jgi:undecaprenyl pyrophosphate phosphatase UppP
MLAAYGPWPLLAGFVAALVSAALSVEFMVRWLEKRSLAIFAGWRLFAAAVVSALVLTNVI